MKRLICCLILLMSASGVALAQEETPVFEPGECPFSWGFTVDCGTLTVPESRTNEAADDSNTITLSVAVFRSMSASPAADPVIYLDGGPGGHTLRTLEFFAASFRPFLQSRDVIFFDQRGVGLSEALDCPEYSELGYALLDEDLNYAEVARMSSDVLLACRATERANGRNLEAYTSVESASDVRDLVAALGYEQVNLFGISYGTRLALTVMRDHPEIVRSAILDAVVPVQANPDSELLVNTDRAFNTLFEGCATDPACATTYPDLETVFYDTVSRLNDEPEMVSTYDFYTGQERDVLVNGDVLIASLFSLLYQTNEIPNLPRYIYEARDGTYDAFVDDMLFTLFYSDYFDETLFMTVGCNEETPFDSADAAAASSDDMPEALRDIFLTDIASTFELCAAWSQPLINDIDNDPVASDIPTLVTVGKYDPVTPPRWAAQAAESLTNSYFYEFPAVGHAVFDTSNCAIGLMVAFINDPHSEPDASCIDNLAPPLFAVTEVTAVNNRPYEHNMLGFASVIPENWYEVEPGVFSPYPAMDQPIPVIAFRFPPTLASYIDQIIISGFYGYDSLPESTERFERNGRVWTIYKIERPDQNVYTSFAFTETDAPYVIGVTATTPEERDYLYEALLIPAVEAFTKTDSASD